jgi:hypothetical protein
MASKFELNDTTPAAPAGKVNVQWQSDVNGNISAYVAPGGAAAVSSVFGRTGAVVAVNGDYSAAQVTNAVDQTGSYANPTWITSLAWSKITGAPATGVSSVFGRSGAVVAVAGDYTAAQVTNAVSILGSYADPAWITSLAWSKIMGAPAPGTPGHTIQEEGTGLTQRAALNFVGAGVVASDDVANNRTIVTIAGGGAVTSVFSRTGAVVASAGDYSAAQVTNAVSTLGSYADPAWITSIAWGKITGAPSVSSYQTPWLSDINAASFKLNNTGGIGIGTSAVITYAIYATVNTTSNIIAFFQNTNAAGAGGFTVQNDGSHSGSILCAGSTYANPAWRNNTVINTGTTDSLILATNSVERVTVTAAGLVGIGMTPATYKLEVSGDVNVTGTYRINGTPISTSQTPWTSDIDGNSKKLNNAYGIGCGAASPGAGFYAYMFSGSGLFIQGAAATSRAEINLRTQVADSFFITMNSTGNSDATLDRAGQINVYNSALVLGNNFGQMRLTTNGDFVFGDCISGTSLVEKFRIVRTTGNVGVGNTAVPPFSAAGYVHLTVGPQSTSGQCGIITACSNTTSAGQAVGSLSFANFSLASADKRIAEIRGDTGTSVDSGSIAFNTFNAGVAGERMRITAAGNVGIGTTNPQVPLQVSGSEELLWLDGVSANGPYMRFYQGGGHKWTIGHCLAQAPAGSFVFYDGAAARMILTNVGTVGIGRVPIAGPDHPLQIHTAADRTLFIGNIAGDTTIQALNDGASAYQKLSIYAAAYVFNNLPTANPGAGTRQLWADPADGYRVKFAI